MLYNYKLTYLITGKMHSKKKIQTLKKNIHIYIMKPYLAQSGTFILKVGTSSNEP